MSLVRLSPMRIAVLLGVALAVLRFVGFTPLALLDARAVDLRLRARGPQPATTTRSRNWGAGPGRARRSRGFSRRSIRPAPR
jgi:hypothetical protein